VGVSLRHEPGRTLLVLLLLLAAVGPAFTQEAATQQSGILFLSLISGTYAQDQSLRAEPVGPRASLRYSIRDPDGAEGPWVPFREALALSAAIGEERDYRIIVRADTDTGEIERRELSIRIDKRPPAPPQVSPPPGVYWDPVSVRFEKGAGDTVFYAVNGNMISDPGAWNGKPISIGTQAARTDFVVQAYSVDAAGNRSGIVTSRYTVDARPAQLEVLSPVAGTFANPQVLALSFRNVQWVRYTLDGSDPAAGLPYTGPVQITKQGVTSVRVAAQPRSVLRPLLRSDVVVTYAPGQGTGLRLDVESGTYTHGISPHVLSAPEGSLYYTLWEKSPAESDFLAGDTITIPGDAGTPHALSVRLRTLSAAGSWSAEYRYFYFVGQAGPSAPIVTVNAVEPVRTPAQAQVIASEDALLSVTTDGSRPSVMSPSGSSLLDVKPGTGTGTMTVLAVAIDGSGTRSPVTQRSITMDGTPGTAPSVRASVSNRTGTVLYSGEAAAGRLVYEITSDGSDPVAPTVGSSTLTLPFSLSVPFGMRRTFKLRAAFLDAAGCVSAAGEPVEATIDRKPPARPVLTPGPGATPLDEPATVSIGSPAGVYVTITSDGTTPPDPSPDAGIAAKLVKLDGIDGRLSTYRIKLLAVDAAGNASEVYGPILYSVDLRPPRIPAITGIADKGRYSRWVSVGIDDSPWNVRYTVTTDGSLPPDPDAASPLLTRDSSFSGEEGSVTRFRLKLLAISHNGMRLGERRELSFTIDLKVPDVPLISGTTKGGRVARAVTLTADPLPADVGLFYSVSSGDADPDDPVATGERYDGPLTFDAPDGVRKDFIVRFATQDDAGNRSPYDRRYRFTVDRELPDDPAVTGVPPGGVSARPVSLSLSAAGTIVYEITDDGSIPRLPTAASTVYTSPLLLTGKIGASVAYRLLARAINDLGTMSRALAVVNVVVDRSVPPAAPAPRILYVPENPDVAYVSWDKPANGRLLFRIMDGTGASGELVAYDSPVAARVAATVGGVIRGEAMLENAAGTRGPSTPFALAALQRLPAPVFRGVRDDGIYTGRVELASDTPQGEQIRYEVATDGAFPPGVTAASPVVKFPLVVDAADGQTLNVRVAARAFDPSGKALPSEETRIAFTIDRTPPDPPVAVGIEDGGYYQDSRSVVLLSAEGTVYYSLSEGKEAALPAQGEANRYTAAIALDALPGQATDYRITAFTVDAAGNRSREIRTWAVTIDRKIVYVSPNGNDFSDGARGTPVRSIAKALQIAAATSRTTIYAAAGVYPSDQQLTVTTDTTVVGGLDPATWTPLGFERWSTITAAAPWRAGSSLLSVTGGALILKGVEIADATESVGSIVSVDGGKLTLAGSQVSLRGAGSAHGIELHSGSLTLSASVLRAEGVRRGALIVATGGSLSAEGIELDGPRDAAEFVCLDFSNVKGVTLKGVTVAPGAGQRMRGIRAVGSQMTISGSRIVSGAGSIDAVAIDAARSDVTIDAVDISTASGARSPTGLLSADCTLNVQHSTISVAGGSSAVGLSARGGSLTLSRSTVRGSSILEYVALVKVEQASSLIANNILKGGDSGQSICILAKGGVGDIFNNTIVGGTGATFTSGIMLQGGAQLHVVNNIIVRSGADRGAAILLAGAGSRPFASGADSSQILTNSLAGWQTLMSIDLEPGTAGSSSSITTIDALNAADGDMFGGSVSGNISEPASRSFRPGSTDDFHLVRTSRLLDAATDLAALRGQAITAMIRDYDGKPRPAEAQLVIPGPARGWDIGAFEYSE
jgi:hypothetical protein